MVLDVSEYFNYLSFIEVIPDVEWSNLKNQATVWKMYWLCKVSHSYRQLLHTVGLKEDSFRFVLFKELWCVVGFQVLDHISRQ